MGEDFAKRRDDMLPFLLTRFGELEKIINLNEAGFKNCKVVKKNASNMVIEARKN